MKKRKKRKQAKYTCKGYASCLNKKAKKDKYPWVMIICTILVFTIIFTFLFVWINNELLNVAIPLGIGSSIFLFIVGYSAEKLLDRFLSAKKHRALRKYVIMLIISVALSSLLSDIPAIKSKALALFNVKNVIVQQDENNIATNNSTNNSESQNETAPDRVNMETDDYLRYAQNREIKFFLDADTSFDLVNFDSVYLSAGESNPTGYLLSIWGQRVEELDSYSDRSDYTDENAFYLQLKNADDYYEILGYYDSKWVEMLPKESELLRVIDQQERYVNEHPSFLLYHRISNNYQTVAQEHLHQDDNKAAAKYYFQKSLLNDIESIKFAGYDNDFNKAIERIYYRYSDIQCCESWTSDAEKSRVEFLKENISW